MHGPKTRGSSSCHTKGHDELALIARYWYDRNEYGKPRFEIEDAALL
jgi:hypothetical protein